MKNRPLTLFLLSLVTLSLALGAVYLPLLVKWRTNWNWGGFVWLESIGLVGAFVLALLSIAVGFKSIKRGGKGREWNLSLFAVIGSALIVIFYAVLLYGLVLTLRSMVA